MKQFSAVIKSSRMTSGIFPVPFLETSRSQLRLRGHTSVFHFMDFVTLVRLSEMIACSCAIFERMLNNEHGEVLSFRGAMVRREILRRPFPIGPLKHAPGVVCTRPE